MIIAFPNRVMKLLPRKISFSVALLGLGLFLPLPAEAARTGGAPPPVIIGNKPVTSLP